ncbi:ankyrin repeat domain-containing protein [Leptospira kanakyensis]|uniref:Ankyrin repeat domain-containing protein n=1 Tax=Leptospira kanakyensis TaxID=2484968 RepID=A0A6N4Q5R6_9LEPT|nr:ankyrin repeat domain-containing protein [Leptospira kanakyensis]TGK50773.1 ankyrin repeat domain-containing protein [Leptospira kanakyensis]TGK63626.1 ankyrin repeat domain-containing protein [Leptospira kanakyensis]TGK69910.1 ankyrin repeat domain-containing protein [Leptospira kanakyensis]
MGKKKKTTLPKNFEELLENGNIDDIKAVFDHCELDARGGNRKHTTIGFIKCPDSVIQWLVEQGADLNATDIWGDTALHQRSRSRISDIKILLELGADLHFKNQSGETPLHTAALAQNPKAYEMLLQKGANLHERNNRGLTALELALSTCSNSEIENTLTITQLSLRAGAKMTPMMNVCVEEIGKQFEFHRKNFDPDSVHKVSQALLNLYEIFNIKPIETRIEFDGKSPIILKSQSWQNQFEELWNLLVPSTGQASTTQGEVIRISGRISNEIEGNGGINWDKDFSLMAESFYLLINSGNTLSSDEMKNLKSVISNIKARNGETDLLKQSAVKWVIQNSLPTKLSPQPYKR